MRVKAGIITAVAACALAAGCGGVDESTETLTLYSDEFNLAAPAAGKTAEDGNPATAGDSFAWWRDFYESDDFSGEPFGRADGEGLATEVSGGTIQQLIEFQMTLDGGSLTASGTFEVDEKTGEATADEYESSILGGTGDYEGASGTITQTPVDDDVDEFEVEITTTD